MELIHDKGLKKGTFKIVDDGVIVADMSYVWTGDDNFIIDHTDVADGYQGQGLGSKMVEAAVIFARENDITIIPLCPFSRAEFDKNPSYKDVRRS